MTRLIFLSAFIIPFLFLHTCAQRGPFVSSEGGFSIDLPGAPGEDKNAGETKLGGKKLGWRDERALFTVSYVDTPNAKVEDGERIVSASADGYISALPKAAEVTSRNKISLDGDPGIEVKTREKDGFTVITRYYMVRQRLYCVVAMWMAGSNDDYVLKKIDSFKVIKSTTVRT